MTGRQIGSIEAFTRSVCLAIVAVLACAVSANAAPVAIGTLSYDEFIPGATNAFNINNFTDAFALPPDFPVLTALTFSGAALHVVEEDGSEFDVALGDIAPGPLLDSGNPLFSLQFASTTGFLSVRLTATLLVSSWLLDDGTTFTPSTLNLIADLFPSNGQVLAAGDFTTISIDSDPVATVPEPATATLILVAGAAAFIRRRLTS
jgi:MprA protease rhombosortase-interaction domain-containing protein